VNTAIYSIVAVSIMVLASVLISYILVRRKSFVTSLLDVLIMVPYVIPGAVLGLCLLVAFNQRPLFLSGTATIMILAYVIRKLPFTLRSCVAMLHQLDAGLEEASVSLGVSPIKTFFRMTVYLMAPGILSGAILSWIATINELSSSIMLYTGKTVTMSIAVYTEVLRGNYGSAAALASILTLGTIASIAGLHLIAKDRVIVTA
jgi:iron(III) transport system permease protein